VCVRLADILILPLFGVLGSHEFKGIAVDVPNMGQGRSVTKAWDHVFVS